MITAAQCRAARPYQIAWRSKITGEVGRGTTQMSLIDAQRSCRELNGDWTDIDHWPEQCQGEKT